MPKSSNTALKLVGPAKDRYEVIFDQASDAILTVRQDGQIDAVNQALEELTGFVRGELLGQSIEILEPKKKTEHRSKPISLEMCRSTGRFEDVMLAQKDGFARYVDMSVRWVEDDKAPVGIILFRDLTERKSMERELITKHSELQKAYFELQKKTSELQSMQETLVQSGKMAALGELAAGIAHELNQPLQAIRGYAQEIQATALDQLACEGHAQAKSLAGGLHEIVSGVDKMASIIEYLRTFTRKSTENHEMTDVHQALEEALKMLSRQFQARGIQVTKNFADDLPEIYANPVQLEQVFINFATNARDAIEATGRGRGTITIETRAVGRVVEVRFRDDGVGMADRTKAKIFNPFFTTKEVGKGMGLGLSLSYGILAKLHGSILVESKLGQGTEFQVRLPVDFRES
mgnify:CR=1 FL=1